MLVTLNTTIRYTTDINAFQPHYFRNDKSFFTNFVTFNICVNKLKLKTDPGVELHHFIKWLQISYLPELRLNNFPPHVNGLRTLNHSLILLKCSLSR